MAKAKTTSALSPTTGSDGIAESDTRTRLLDSAEAIFAQHGFVGSSVRDIANSAGANIAAVGYHFGSKENLFLEVVRRRVRPINQQRLADLAKVVEKYAPKPPPIAAVLDALVRSTVEQCCNDTVNACPLQQLMVRVLTEADSVARPIYTAEMIPMIKEFVMVIQRIYPGVQAPRITTSLMFYAGAMINLLNWSHRGIPDTIMPQFAAQDPEHLIRILVRWGVNGFRVLREE